MTDPEFDRTRPRLKAGQAMYRCQLPPYGYWTEWRDIAVPIREPYILTFELTEGVTEEQYDAFRQQITVSKQ